MRVAAVLVVAAFTLPAAAGAAAAPRADFNQIEKQVMCVSCQVPLEVAESPQADAERREIKALIAQGFTAAQVRHRLVQEYGDGVLALPPAKGFDLAAYLVPIGAVIAVLALLGFTFARWRRRPPADPAEDDPGQAPTGADAKRLEEDLARYGV